MSGETSSNRSSGDFTAAHTRTLSSSHTRTLSNTHSVAPSAPAPVQTTGLGTHTQQLTSIPSELPQLMVTTPTTLYSAYTSHSSSSSFGNAGTPFSPPTHIPDVPAIPEEYRQPGSPSPQQPTSPAVQPSIDSVDFDAKQAAPHPKPPALPALVITNATPPPSQTRFASPMMANPNMPVLPKIATPGSANVARKPVPAVSTDAAAVARVKAGGKAASSPPSAGKAAWTPGKPFGAGSISTMSPVAAARSFNARRGTPQQPTHIHTNNDSVDSPTLATASLYSSMKTQDKADRSLADRVVAKETLFDLDVDAEADATGEDARELPLEDLIKDELPEYIQVYLTPHPDREQGSWGEGEKKDVKGFLDAVDEKGELKDKEKEELERRAAKWNDVEATLPAYKSTASLERAAPFSRNTPSPTSASKTKKPIMRRCIPHKPSTRIICIVALITVLLIIPAVVFGVVYSLQHKHRAGDLLVAQSSQGSDSANPTITLQDAPDATVSPSAGGQAETDKADTEGDGASPPPIVAPMTTPN